MSIRLPRLRTQPVAELTANDWQMIIEQAQSVLERTEGLVASIRQRQNVGLYFDHRDRFIGIATYDIDTESFHGRKATTIYTGNCWINPKWRGANLIQLLAMRVFICAKRQWPMRDVYWFYGSNNYKSYMLLTKNFENYWPRHDLDTPPWERAFIGHLAKRYYGEGFDPSSGVWHGSGARSFKGDDTNVGEKLSADPAIRYYLGHNPGYSHGDRLMCLAPLSMNNGMRITERSAGRVVRKHTPIPSLKHVPKLSTMATAELTPEIGDELIARVSGLMTHDRDLVARLRKHQYVAIFRDRGGAIIATITYDLMGIAFEGRKIAVLYTGGGWMHPDWRNANLMQMLAVRVVATMRRRWPLRPAYWFHGSYSYRTYQMLQNNLKTYWPRPDEETPAFERSLMSHLGEHFFGANFDPDTGIWRNRGDAAFQVEDQEIPPEVLAAPELAYYFQQNPGVTRGDRLACLAPINYQNISAMTDRAIVRVARSGKRQKSSVQSAA